MTLQADALTKVGPDFGLGLPFLVLASGETAGAPLSGFLWNTAGSTTALYAFAALMAGAAVWAANTASVRGNAVSATTE